MSIGIGIDTGGTYTDAVLYDFEQKRILDAAKALTTKADLAQGIGEALDGLSRELLGKAEIVSLSTTLATNACVENKGGRAKLMLINVYKKVVEEYGAKYGLPKAEQIFFINGPRDKNGKVTGEPDWNTFDEESREWLSDADSLGVVEMNARENNASLEKKVRSLVGKAYDIPVICGHELFSDLNSLRRGSSILLNARLLPIMENFFLAIKAALKKRDIQAPVVIVRSDGSLMSEKFTGIRPVETLLCGPAASVAGGVELTQEKDCLIIDMGGTTTDISLVKNGSPVLVQDGVNVGKWRTFVKGVFIETFGLGGDSAVRYDRYHNVSLAPYRVVPLAMAASQWPVITEKLTRLVSEKKRHSQPLHEFFILVRDISKNANYTDEERAFVSALKDGPLMLGEAAHAIGKDFYSFNMGRLEKEGIVIRSGLTPTDVMHVKGDFCRYNIRAAELGMEFVACSVNTAPELLAETVYDQVKKTLYSHIIKLIVADGYPSLRKTGLGRGLETLISESWEIAKRKQENIDADMSTDISGEEPAQIQNAGKCFLDFRFSTPATLVGIGAPIHIFLPDVAQALGAKYLVPDNAGVANALGAIVGHIAAVCEIEIGFSEELSGYIVYGRDCNRTFKSLEEAADIAAAEAKAGAREEAVKRGAVGEISFSVELIKRTAHDRYNMEVFLGATAVAKAWGRISL